MLFYFWVSLLGIFFFFFLLLVFYFLLSFFGRAAEWTGANIARPGLEHAHSTPGLGALEASRSHQAGLTIV